MGAGICYSYCNSLTSWWKKYSLKLWVKLGKKGKWDFEKTEFPYLPKYLKWYYSWSKFYFPWRHFNSVVTISDVWYYMYSTSPPPWITVRFIFKLGKLIKLWFLYLQYKFCLLVAMTTTIFPNCFIQNFVLCSLPRTD